jgi:hypothetical protein
VDDACGLIILCCNAYAPISNCFCEHMGVTGPAEVESIAQVAFMTWLHSHTMQTRHLSCMCNTHEMLRETVS